MKSKSSTKSNHRKSAAQSKGKKVERDSDSSSLDSSDAEAESKSAKYSHCKPTTRSKAKKLDSENDSESLSDMSHSTDAGADSGSTPDPQLSVSKGMKGELQSTWRPGNAEYFAAGVAWKAG